MSAKDSKPTAAKRPVGRPTRKTEDIVEIILENRRLGLSMKTCCQLAMIETSTAYRWLQNDKDFAAKWENAGGEIVRALHARVAATDPWKILKNIEPTVYRDRIEQEISGNADAPLSLVVTDLRVEPNGGQDGKAKTEAKD